MENTGVLARQRAETSERVVTYDKKAFVKAWGHLASSSSDGEDG